MTPVLLPANTQDVTQEALSIPDQVAALRIMDAPSYEYAAEFWKQIGDLMKKVDESFDPIITRAHQAHKEALAQKAKIYNPLDKARREVKGMMEAFDREQERLRQEEAARIREALRREEEERRLAEAVQAEQEGDKDMAEAIMDEAPYVPPVILPKATPKVSGGPVFRTVWKAKVVNPTLVPREYLMVDETKLNRLAAVMKGNFKVPGVEFYSQRV